MRRAMVPATAPRRSRRTPALAPAATSSANPPSRLGMGHARHARPRHAPRGSLRRSPAPGSARTGETRTHPMPPSASHGSKGTPRQQQRPQPKHDPLPTEGYPSQDLPARVLPSCTSLPIGGHDARPCPSSSGMAPDCLPQFPWVAGPGGMGHEGKRRRLDVLDGRCALLGGLLRSETLAPRPGAPKAFQRGAEASALPLKKGLGNEPSPRGNPRGRSFGQASTPGSRRGSFATGHDDRLFPPDVAAPSPAFPGGSPFRSGIGTTPFVDMITTSLVLPRSS